MARRPARRRTGRPRGVGNAASAPGWCRAAGGERWIRAERGEDGTALVELVWLGIILLVPLVWIVLSVFEVQRGAFAVTSAARSAARAFALADSDPAGEADARAAIRQAFADQGGDDREFRFDVTCGSADCHVAGAVITVRVWTRVDLPLLPGILGGEAPSFALDSTHTVPIGQFRDL